MQQGNENYVNHPNCVHLCSRFQYCCDCAHNNVTGRRFYAPGTSAHARAQLFTLSIPGILTQTIYFLITSLITTTTWLLGGWKARTSKIYSSWQKILHPLTFRHVHIHESLAHSLINIILYLLSPASLFYVPGGLYIDYSVLHIILYIQCCNIPKRATMKL